jgi:hypothetical protein
VDDDPVLRALSAELERDDPELAARLTAGPRPPGGDPLRPGAGRPDTERHRGILWLLLTAAVIGVAAPVAFGPPAFGVLGVLLLLSCPLLVWRWAGPPDEGPPDTRPHLAPP